VTAEMVGIVRHAATEQEGRAGVGGLVVGNG
jgi:D-amino-acid dehydrogenase